MVIILDRDGVINMNRDRYVRTPDELCLIEGSAPAIARLNQAGYRVLVISNQAGIGKGLISKETLAAIHERLGTMIEAHGARIDAFYVCPHIPEADCACRKPRPGLIHRAQQDWQFVPEETFVVGDNWKDVETAVASRCKPVLVRSGVHGEKPKPDPGVPDFESLAEFVDGLLDEDRG